jgi:hypothetical protein
MLRMWIAYIISQQPDKHERSWQLLKPGVGVDDEKKTGGVQETALGIQAIKGSTRICYKISCRPQ